MSDERGNADDEFENEDEDFEDNDDYDDEEDFDSLAVQAKYYTYATINGFLKKCIENFSTLHMTADDLVVVSKLLKLTEDPNKYEILGYASIMVKEKADEENFTFKEIKFDMDGLELLTGGYVTEGDWGSDSYSTIIFPVDEDEAEGTVTELGNFTREFYSTLEQAENERSFEDSIDEIKEK